MTTEKTINELTLELEQLQREILIKKEELAQAQIAKFKKETGLNEGDVVIVQKAKGIISKFEPFLYNTCNAYINFYNKTGELSKRETRIYDTKLIVKVNEHEKV